MVIRLGKLALVCAILLAVNAETAAAVRRYLTGNPADVHPALHGPAYDFGGGGSDVNAAIQWMIDQVRGCSDCPVKVDVVVLRSSGADGYNAPIYAMRGVDSVETLVITSREDANSKAVETTVRNAEVVFFAGGDQCNYVKYFRGTRLAAAVDEVNRRGGGIGGTSAGLAILGEYAYDACTGNLSVRSKEALADPYNGSMSFSYRFLRLAHMKGSITDTHFVARDRMGRLLAFIARQIEDRWSDTVLGIAVDERTSVIVDKRGLARVLGKGPAYFVLGDHAPEMCRPGRPLTYSGYKVWKIPAGGTFDLARRPTAGYYPLSVVDGRITKDPY